MLHNPFNQLVKPALIATALLSSALSFAAGTLSPVGSPDAPLEIKTHDVKVNVTDGLVSTTVDQVFYNPYSYDVDGVYSFPIPEDAAVAELTMWIDGQPITGEVLEKEQARQIHNDQKAKGNETALMEQDGFKTFETMISPVRGHQETRIRFKYYQTAFTDTGIGRYVYQLEDGGVDEEKSAFWSTNQKVSERFSFKMNLRSGYPIDAVRLPQHSKANILQISPQEWQISLANLVTAVLPAEQALDSQIAAIESNEVNVTKESVSITSLDKDIVVYWRHQPDLPGSVDLITYKPEADKKGTFMLTFTPGDDLKPINEGIDWVFVLDTSGSMSGKYATLAAGVEKALNSMRPNDRFNIITFGSRSSSLTYGYQKASAGNIRKYINKVSNVKVAGGTNLYDGLSHGFREFDADRTTSIILVTDGVANIGETQTKKFVELVKSKDIRLYTFIMGNSANKPLLRNLTNVSNGFSASISNSDDIVGQIQLAKSKVTHEAFNNVKLKINGAKISDVSPKNIRSLYHGQQLIVMGHYWKEGEVNVSLEGTISGVEKKYETKFTLPMQSQEFPELERLWAYREIRALYDEIELFGESDDYRKAATDLALEYSLVTPDTSLLVVREEVFKELGIERRNKARLAREDKATEARQSQQVKSRRVDTAQPTYTNSRPSIGGGGAINPLLLVLLLPLISLFRRK